MPATDSPLTRVPVAKRKQLAATLGLFAVLFVAVGAVAATGPATLLVRVFVVISLLVAVLLAMMGWGVVHSIRDEHTVAADRDLDALIDETLAAAPRTYGSLCTCGHAHDPTELHIVDELGTEAIDGMDTGAVGRAAADACAVDGAHLCDQSCGDCVLTSLRPSPNQTRSERLSS